MSSLILVIPSHKLYSFSFSCPYETHFIPVVFSLDDHVRLRRAHLRMLYDLTSPKNFICWFDLISALMFGTHFDEARVRSSMVLAKKNKIFLFTIPIILFCIFSFPSMNYKYDNFFLIIYLFNIINLVIHNNSI